MACGLSDGPALDNQMSQNEKAAPLMQLTSVDKPSVTTK